MKVFNYLISIIRGFGATQLLLICFATSTMADLRIATTVDYAPFSYRESGKLTGIDIDLITDLSQELSKISITSRVVKTTWPTLIEDLLSDSFDIAISGISRSPERSTIADLSLTYFVTGKTALTNWDFTHKFDVIEDLNHQNIRVIVNPENGQPAPYLRLSHGIEALITRSVFYDLVEWAEEDSALGELFVQSNRSRFSLGLVAVKDEPQ